MSKKSAGLLMFRRTSLVEVLLVHPGGPFWSKKDIGSWSIPKGEYEDEDALLVAQREFQEETSYSVTGNFLPLSPLRQPGGKVVSVWAVEGDCAAAGIKSNTFVLEWPPRSGRQQEFPEVDRAEWFSLSLAREKILKGQIGFLHQLEQLLSAESNEP
ncbi:MAG: NUDIX domain-containing protein [Acidobacteriota bacterium]